MEQATTSTRTWMLTPAEFEQTKKRAGQINRRATKRGFTGRIDVTGVEREISETTEGGLQRTVLMIETQITGEPPRYNGWEFLAAVDTVETETGTDFVLRTAPGIEESGVDRARLTAGRCDHCKVDRPNRRYTYLVREEQTGEYVQVGSTCIRDFTGWEGKPVFISIDELAKELVEPSSQGGNSYFSPESVLAAAWAISRIHGWAPASADVPTKTLVSSYLYGTSRADREFQHQIHPEIPAALPRARQIITELLDGLDGSSDYVTNLKTCLRAIDVDPKHLGIVVSAIATHERMTGEAARRKAAAADRVRARELAEYAGIIGEQLTLTGTVTRLRTLEGSYGYNPKPSQLIILEGGTTVAKMITSAGWAWDIEQGDTLEISATVRAHEEYNEIKQTVLSRPKLIAAAPEGER